MLHPLLRLNVQTSASIIRMVNLSARTARKWIRLLVSAGCLSCIGTPLRAPPQYKRLLATLPMLGGCCML